MRADSMTFKALVILTREGQISADDFGASLWKDKKRGRVTSSGGGGDYGAQMFLGRLKKRGYARSAHTLGSSLWEATAAGSNALAKAYAVKKTNDKSRRARNLEPPAPIQLIVSTGTPVDPDDWYSGFGSALAQIWRLHHDGQMVRHLMTSSGFTLKHF